MISVLIVDDQALVRSAVRELLAPELDIIVIGEAMNGLDAVEQALRLQPRIVLMDIRMPEADGIEATSLIRGHPLLPDTRVLMLSTFEEDHLVISALRLGASGYVGKGSEPGEIARAIRAVDAGDGVLSPAATRTVVSWHQNSGHPRLAIAPSSRSEFAHLTDREREVLKLVARGRGNSQIGERLGISPLTAKTHVNRVMSKLGAHDRSHLVMLAYEGGLVVPGEE